MENSAVVLIGTTALGLIALVAFLIYKWEQKKRVHRIEQWVKDYVLDRYGDLPNPLNIKCSDDMLWPVLMAFDTPRTATRHRLQFICEKAHSTFALLSEKEEKR